MAGSRLAVWPTTEKNETKKLMKTPIKLAMISMLGILTSTAGFAQSAPGNDSPPSDPPRGRPGTDRPSPEAHRKMLLEKYDANKDGKLDDTELSALGRDVFEGKLPPPNRRPRGPGFGPQGRGGPDGPGFGPPVTDGLRGERSPEFRPRGPHDGDGPRPPRGPMADRRGFGRDGGPERRFGPGPHGFGGPNSEAGRKMLEERRREFIKQYDLNGDGKLDSAEREAIGKDIEDGKLLPPPPARQEAPPREQ